MYNDDGTFLGSTTTDASGAYSFTDLPNDIYSIAIPTSVAPYNLLTLTTDLTDTPASSITTTGTSVYQTVTVSGASIAGMDFAFKFDGLIDFGDLPAPYATLLSDVPSGAYHVVEVAPSLYFGASVDTESIPVLNNASSGDDIIGTPDDEDGIAPLAPNTWISGSGGGNIDITVVGTGWVVGFMDFNGDGDFTDVDELVVNQAFTTGTTTISIDIPLSVPLTSNTDIYSRFRLFETAPLIPEFAYTGFAINGEVEDHRIRVIKSRRITTNLFLGGKIVNKNN